LEKEKKDPTGKEETYTTRENLEVAKVTHSIRRVELAEVENLPKEATVKETGVMSMMKSKVNKMPPTSTSQLLKNLLKKVRKRRKEKKELPLKKFTKNHQPKLKKKKTPRILLLKNTWLKRRRLPTKRKLDNLNNLRKITLKRLKLENKRLKLLLQTSETKKPTALLLARTKMQSYLDSKVKKMTSEVTDHSEVEEVAEEAAEAEEAQDQKEEDQEVDKPVVQEVADNNS